MTARAATWPRPGSFERSDSGDSVGPPARPPDPLGAKLFDRHSCYEARESVNNADFSVFLSFNHLFECQTFPWRHYRFSTDIGGFGGLVPLIPARPDPHYRGKLDGTLGSPRPAELCVWDCGWDFDPPVRADATVVGTLTPRSVSSFFFDAAVDGTMTPQLE